jgi:hypothetical protein
MNSLGGYFLHGVGVPADPHSAVKWIRRAADAGHSMAQFNLGLSYRDGLGVAEDSDEALRLFDLAAAGGFARAAEHARNLRAALHERVPEGGNLD